MPSSNNHASATINNHNIAATLTSIVDQYMQDLRQSSPFFAKLRKGEISPEIMASVLKTIIYALRFTPVHLQRAEFAARQAGYDDLANFFNDKAIEEYRHEDWAIEDLQALPCSSANKAAAQAVGSVVELMDYLGELIRENPRNYLAYIYVNEHIAVTVFPELVEKLQKMCGISKDSVTVLTKHLELDQQHSNDDQLMLNSYFAVKNNQDLQRKTQAELFSVVYKSLSFYDKMFADFSDLAA